MRQDNGFTLVELSIALVVIGLVAGGILTGRHLIGGAEIRSLTSQLEKHQAAIQTFRTKYRSLPGDFTDAGKNWGATCGGDTPAPAGCNGNGDGVVDDDVLREGLKGWQHLSLAGMIPGSFTGLVGGTPRMQPGVNAPAGIRSSSYRLYASQGAYGFTLPSGFPPNHIQVANYYHDVAWDKYGVLNGLEAADLDKKIDDGLPEGGLLLGLTHNGTGICKTGAAGSRVYKLDTEDRACVLAQGFMAR